MNRVAVALLLVHVAAVLAAGSEPRLDSHGFIEAPLTSEVCERSYANKPAGDFTTLDHCSVCDRIVYNRYHWNYKSHPSALCTGVPDYAMDTCRYMACQMLKCSDFLAGSCLVQKGHTGVANMDENIMTITPCPAKYLCYTCMKELFPEQVPGCFDSLARR